METSIAVALIAAIGTVLAALVQKGRQENKDDHALVMTGLARIENKIDTHLQDHSRHGMK